MQRFLAADVLADARLVVLTGGAAQVLPGEGVADLAGAAAAGLVRSAQSENPGRLVLADLPAAGAGGAEDAGLAGLVAGVLASGEPEVAVRDGVLYGRRLARPRAGLVPPAGGMPWRLEPSGTGSLQDLTLAPSPEAAAPLADGQVRVAVRAGGLNFRDVMIALGMYPGAAVLGSEIAGVVVEAGPGVPGLVPGDRVMGLATGGFGPLAVVDARSLALVPGGWSFAQAAAVPVAFATAWYGLRDLAAARPGQRLLVHAATGGVGMAAVTIARHLGLEVFATASPAKHPLLRSMGFDEDHIASSRDAGFEDKFRAGVDIVLNALAGELTDASLRLLAPGGTFLEMGKTDLRDPARLVQDHPGTAYRPFDLSDAGPERTGEMLRRYHGPAGGRGTDRLPGPRLGHPPGGGGVPVHEPGPPHRQARPDRPGRPRRPPRGGDRPGDRRHRHAWRPRRPSPGRNRAGPGGAAYLPHRARGPRRVAAGCRGRRIRGASEGRGVRRRGQGRPGATAGRGAADRGDPRGRGARRRDHHLADPAADRERDAG